MTSAQVYSNLGALKRAGFFNDPDLKNMVMEKMKSGAKDPKMVAARARQALDAAEIDDQEIVDTTDDMMTENLRSQYQIGRDTAVIIDASGSMDESLEVGKQIVAQTATAIAPNAKLFTYTFNTGANEFFVDDNERSIVGVEKALKGVRAAVGTSYGAVIDAMIRKGQVVEQFVFAGDDAENTPPHFERSYKEYSEKFGVFPDVILVNIPGEYGNSISRVLVKDWVYQ